MNMKFYDSSGREVRSLGDAVSSQIDKAMTDRLRSVRCPIHGAAARRVQVRRLGTSVTYDAGPLCCERLKERIAASFR